MVWFSCLILVILSTILLHLTISSSSGSDENRSINHRRITDSVLSMVACVCQMDSSVRSSVTSSRIIMVSYSEFFSLVYIFFSLSHDDNLGHHSSSFFWHFHSSIHATLQILSRCFNRPHTTSRVWSNCIVQNWNWEFMRHPTCGRNFNFNSYREIIVENCIF